MRTWRVISTMAENKPHAHHKTHLHTMKVYNTRPVSLLLIKILSARLIIPSTLSRGLFNNMNFAFSE